MSDTATKHRAVVRRHARVRKKVSGTAERPRLAVFRSNRHVYAQLIDDANGVALQNIGTIYLRQNKVPEAETWVRKAIAADPQLANAYTTLGVILSRQQRPDEAIDAWRRAVDLDGREFDALYNVTLALAQRGARDLAVSYGERFLATAPEAFYAADLANIRRLLGR